MKSPDNPDEPAEATGSPERPRRVSKVGRRAFAAVGIVAAVAIVAVGVVDAASSGGGADARSQLTLIAPAAAGGGWDGAAREAQQALRAQGIVNNTQVVNIPGAGGTIGLSQFTGMAGDSATMMVMGITMLGAININGSDVDLGDVTPIARLADDYDVVVVPADSPIQTLDDLMVEWRADPDRFAFGGGSLGSVDQMIISRMAQENDIDPAGVNYIAYSGGGELATSLMSGTIKASVSGYEDFVDQIEAGNLRALAISAPEPVDSIDLPTLIELGYDVSLTNWRGIVAPPGITEEQRTELEAIVTEMVETPEWRDALERNRWTDTFAAGEEFAAGLRSETEFVDGIWADLGY
ncbi:tricarboxylic transporter [Rhodococcus sp. 06-156-3C]|nr:MULTISPECIES: tripartite tricarboxylate transporter substrate-binding protein [Rhodococcus]OZD08795.1 tricarboxylic transporter [Rhodococcus sp. 06-156-4C]OZD17387.1 tricarboxylic transporter [Rhodococcus sp. 06-156-3C]OZD18725.1 tricarboxylic transporter [Rhodococcus sp. 06-156-4a]OZD25116.1 tricarboxylic transporter [Rhodococcus sp. 06-156-3b]OZD34275.1 tricarboxylic transporter [Rhodococcus sp. 06-156-3]